MLHAALPGRISTFTVTNEGYENECTTRTLGVFGGYAKEGGTLRASGGDTFELLQEYLEFKNGPGPAAAEDPDDPPVRVFSVCPSHLFRRCERAGGRSVTRHRTAGDLPGRRRALPAPEVDAFCGRQRAQSDHHARGQLLPGLAEGGRQGSAALATRAAGRVR